jgi:hypothetical protein
MSEFIDQTLVDPSGEEVGTITDVIPDPVDMTPEWLVVRVGRFGGEHFLPANAVESLDGRLVAAVPRDRVKSAPRVRRHIDPDPTERDALYRHYGLAS